MQTQLHTVYRNHQGNIIPGVTSIIDQLGWNKSALICWAKKLVRQGLDPDRVRDQGAEIGTLARELIHAHLMGKQADYRCRADAGSVIGGCWRHRRR